MSAPAPQVLPPPPSPARDWALFLDVDGCLLDFADRPEDVDVPAGLRADLARLQAALGGAVALVSGRRVEQLDALFAPLRLPGAGLHGLQLRASPAQPAGTDEAPPALTAVRAEAAQVADTHPGARVEDKGPALALHWRAAPQAREPLEAVARAAVERLPGYRLQPGNCVVELRPDGHDKGSALERLMDSPPFAGRLPVFAGDDLTDEDGFEAVRRLGGLGVIVGDRRPTAAMHALEDTAALRRWLAEAARRLGDGA